MQEIHRRCDVKYLIALALCLGIGMAWGMDMSTPIHNSDMKNVEYTYQNNLDTWFVSRGSETYTLKEFVESGRFCEWNGGHQWKWIDAFSPSPCGGIGGQICSVCSHCRTRIKVQKEEYGWEP